MSSHELGKAIIYDWIRENITAGSSCLDVGACDGVWGRHLRDHFATLDAVEAFKPNVERHKLKELYDLVYEADVRTLSYDKYNLVIFGDVLEHMSTEEARNVLDYAEKRANTIIVAVPFMYHQGAIYGNPYEVHVQDDLTRENVKERYPELQELVMFPNYGYYVWRVDNDDKRMA